MGKNPANTLWKENHKTFMHKLIRFLIVNIISLFLVACANRGSGPEGGAKDETPPRIVKSSIENEARNVKKNRIDITFDELIAISGQSNISVSPTQKTPPIFTVTGKTLRIILNDTLKENTTYTIDLSNHIADVNEGNKIEEFYFTFSTGEFIDSLRIEGRLLDAATLNPVAGTVIGVYSADSARETFTTQAPDRMARTNAEGKFSMRNLREGEYRIVALTDLNNNRYYDRNEYLAFGDTTIIPTVSTQEVRDTIVREKQDTIIREVRDTIIQEMQDTIICEAIDTIICELPDSIAVKTITVYSPSNVILYYFKEDFEPQYFQKAERKESHKFSIYFNAPNEELPQLTPFGFEFDGKYLLEKNARKDTLVYWLADSVLIAKDTLAFQLDYFKTDTLDNLVPAVDTLRLSMRTAVAGARNRKKETEPQAKKKEFLSIETNIRSKMDLNQAIQITFAEPVKSVAETVILQEKVDTLWKDLPVKLEQTDEIARKYRIEHTWKLETEYKLVLDSATFYSIYDKENNKTELLFKTKSLEDYAVLFIDLQNVPEKSVFQLLTKDEKVVKQLKAEDDEIFIEYIYPGDYYMRLFVDENEKWDAGSYTQNRQPEKVYYFPKKLQMPANWDIEEEWDITALPVLEQKPQELIKIMNEKK